MGIKALTKIYSDKSRYCISSSEIKECFRGTDFEDIAFQFISMCGEYTVVVRDTSRNIMKIYSYLEFGRLSLIARLYKSRVQAMLIFEDE